MAMGLARRNAGRTRPRWSNGAVVGPGSGGAALPGLRWPHRDGGLGRCGAIDSFRVEQGNARAGRRLRHARGGHPMLQVQVLMAARSGDQDRASDHADVAAWVPRRHRAGASVLVGSCAGWGRRLAGKAGVPVRLEARAGLRDACVRLSVPGSQSGSASNRHMAHRMPYQRAAVRPWVARNGRH